MNQRWKSARTVAGAYMPKENGPNGYRPKREKSKWSEIIITVQAVGQAFPPSDEGMGLVDGVYSTGMAKHMVWLIVWKCLSG